MRSHMLFSQICIVLVTRTLVRSLWARDQLYFATENDKVVVPVIVDPDTVKSISGENDQYYRSLLMSEAEHSESLGVCVLPIY